MNDTETKKRLDPIEKARANPTSNKLAIAGFCYRCVGGENSNKPNVIRASVRDCQAPDCLLWPVRPWQRITTKVSKA